MLTVGSLFSGVGGMDLGLERAGMRVVWQCEIDRYARETVLARHWPNVPCFEDARLVDWTAVTRPDVLAGGFMCTDLAAVGKMAGLDGNTRSGITWRELVRAIVSLQPGYVLVENVPELVSGDDGRWFATVLGKLAEIGYDAEWGCIPASFLGAPHRRERVFIVAYPIGTGGAGLVPRSYPRPVGPWGMRGASALLTADPFKRGNLWPQPLIRRMDDGVSRRVDRLRGIGNAVVPAVAELIGGWIVAHAAANHTRSAA